MSVLLSRLREIERADKRIRRRTVQLQTAVRCAAESFRRHLVCGGAARRLTHMHKTTRFAGSVPSALRLLDVCGRKLHSASSSLFSFRDSPFGLVARLYLRRASHESVLDLRSVCSTHDSCEENYFNNLRYMSSHIYMLTR